MKGGLEALGDALRLSGLPLLPEERKYRKRTKKEKRKSKLQKQARAKCRKLLK